jgi:hypothetical protein
VAADDADTIVPSMVAQGAPSSFVKYGWSSHRFERLKTLVREFEASQPGVIRPTFKPKRPGYDLIFRVDRQPPDEFALLAGDVIGGLRDSLDHLIFELSAFHSPTVDPNVTAWPGCERRSQWPVKPSSRRGARLSPVERKVAGLPVEAQVVVCRHQPFYRKRTDRPHVRHPLRILDELRNMDKHRRLGVMVVSVSRFEATVTPASAFTILRHQFTNRPPRDGSVVERVWLSPGVAEADFRVDVAPQCIVCLDEPTAYPSPIPMLDALNALARQVATVLMDLHDFQPPRARAYMEAGPFRET